MRVISYNLRKHRAASELGGLVEDHDPDILCLQECDTEDLSERIGGLELAETTQRNRLGLALYYRSSTFRADAVKSFELKKSLHDLVFRPARERVLGVRLHEIDSRSELIVASFHAAPLTALNSLRREQIRAAMEELHTMGDALPVLMVGDYNYPVFKENLSERVRQHGYTIALSDERTYTRYRIFRGHYDFATSSGVDIESIRTLPQRSSDHRPILVTAA